MGEAKRKRRSAPAGSHKVSQLLGPTDVLPAGPCPRASPTPPPTQVFSSPTFPKRAATGSGSLKKCPLGDLTRSLADKPVALLGSGLSGGLKKLAGALTCSLPATTQAASQGLSQVHLGIILWDPRCCFLHPLGVSFVSLSPGPRLTLCTKSQLLAFTGRSTCVRDGIWHQTQAQQVTTGLILHPPGPSAQRGVDNN